MEMGKQTPGAHVPSSFHLQGKARPTHFQNAGRGSHCRGTLPKMLSYPSIYSFQNHRLGQRTGSHRPLRAQPSYFMYHLQNFHSRESKELGSQTLPLHTLQSLGCFPPCTHPPLLPEIPGLHSHRQALILPIHDLWDQHRPKNILPSHHRGSEAPSQTGNRSLGIYRRLVTVGQVTNYPHSIHSTHRPLSSEIGVHPKSTKVTANAIPKHHIPGDHMVGPSAHTSPKLQNPRERVLPGPGNS